MADMDRDEMKLALKEGLKEWLDAKFAELGKWTMGTITAAALGVLVYVLLKIDGWHK